MTELASCDRDISNVEGEKGLNHLSTLVKSEMARGNMEAMTVF